MLYLTRKYVCGKSDWYIRTLFYICGETGNCEINEDCVKMELYETPTRKRLAEVAEVSTVTLSKGICGEPLSKLLLIPTDTPFLYFKDNRLLERIVNCAASFSPGIKRRNAYCKVALYMLLSIAGGKDQLFWHCVSDIAAEVDVNLKLTTEILADLRAKNIIQIESWNTEGKARYYGSFYIVPNQCWVRE